MCIEMYVVSLEWMPLPANGDTRKTYIAAPTIIVSKNGKFHFEISDNTSR